MSTTVSIHPEPGSVPSGDLNPGTYPGQPAKYVRGPFVVLYPDSHGGASISLGQLDDAQAVAYLDRLSAVAGELADRLRARQDTALLAAVEATPAGGA